MSKILVIHDRDSAHSVVEEVLAEINIQPIVQHIDLYDEYDFSASPFDLFIFELHRDSRKGILLLQRLAKISVTSGVSFPPVIVVSAENTDDIEHMVRSARAGLYFGLPLPRRELQSVVQEILRKNSSS